MDSIIRNFQSTIDAEDPFIISPSLKKRMIRKRERFYHQNILPFHKWKILHFNQTKKVKILFPLKKEHLSSLQDLLWIMLL